jgi:RNA polymerase sigma factor (sigma-70 family)
MATGQSRPLGQQVERLWGLGTGSGLSDAELLERFNGTKSPVSDQAFEVLVERHGPMVLGVCRHILRRPQDADDAFQATFLVLVRKARSIRVGTSLAPWLYAVAHRTALRARARSSHHGLPDAQVPDATSLPPASEAMLRDVRSMLHDELNRLPEKYRTPIVLCHLEGKSHEEAARMLAWPVGTVSGRLSRGRQLLKDRLERRGLASSTGLLATPFLGEAMPVPPSGLVDTTLKAVLGVGTAHSLSRSVLILTQGVLSAMLLNRLRTGAIVLMTMGTVAGAVAVMPRWLPAAPGNGQEPAPPSQKIQKTFSTAADPQGTDPAPPQRFPAAYGSFTREAKNYPNLSDPRKPIPVFQVPSILMVETPDGKGLAAMNTAESGEWKRYDVPPGQTAMPIAGPGILCLCMKGETITEIAAFADGWVPQRLLHPVREEIWPVVGPGAALYQAGNTFYAFSAAAGWGVLELQDGEKPRAQLGPSEILVQQGDRLYVFPLRTARWSKGIAMKLTLPKK